MPPRIHIVDDTDPDNYRVLCRHCGWIVAGRRNGRLVCSVGRNNQRQRKRKRVHGYVLVLREGKWQREHRLVMAEMLGRPLYSHETPHHINGVRHDNRPENLELWSTSQPAGQRVKDKIKWAKEFLALYEESS